MCNEIHDRLNFYWSY